VVIECKPEGLGEAARAQCYSELIYLFKTALGHNKRVYAILTNAQQYEMYSIDPTNTDLAERKLKINATPNYTYGTINFGDDLTKAGEQQDDLRPKWSFIVQGNNETAVIIALLHAILKDIKQ